MENCLFSSNFLTELPASLQQAQHFYQLVDPTQLAPLKAENQRVYSKSLIITCAAYLITETSYDSQEAHDVMAICEAWDEELRLTCKSSVFPFGSNVSTHTELEMKTFNPTRLSLKVLNKIPDKGKVW